MVKTERKMAMGLFRDQIEKRCSYCMFSGQISEDACICAKRGVVSPGNHCRKFRYDPLKRVPPRPKAPDFSQFQNADFSL